MNKNQPWIISIYKQKISVKLATTVRYFFTWPGLWLWKHLYGLIILLTLCWSLMGNSGRITRLMIQQPQEQRCPVLQVHAWSVRVSVIHSSDGPPRHPLDFHHFLAVTRSLVAISLVLIGWTVVQEMFRRHRNCVCGSGCCSLVLIGWAILHEMFRRHSVRKTALRQVASPKQITRTTQYMRYNNKHRHRK